MTCLGRGVSGRSLAALLGFFLCFAILEWATAEEAEPEAEDFAETAILRAALEPWKGDLDGIIERGMLRVAIPYGLMTYFLDGADQRGPTFEGVRAFEDDLLRARKLKPTDLTLVVLPARRDEIFAMLTDGRADLAAGLLTVTEERRQIVDFSEPLYADIKEVILTGPDVPAGSEEEALSAVEIFVRPSSSFYEHLQARNAERKAAGKPPFKLREADENLRTEDLVEMVNAGLIQATMADEPVADFLVRIFDGVVVHRDYPVAVGGDFAWAFRKDSPQLAAAVNAHVKKAGKGTALGNMILQRYLKSTKWAERALGEDSQQRLRELIEFFKAYSHQYGFDWLMVVAQGYQESRLDQTARSPAGALGVMQLLPSTAKDPNVGIPDITDASNNIHAGVKYLRFLRERYYSDPRFSDLERTLFSFAAYNAGPGNVAKARRRAEAMGLDPYTWFDNVEIAIARTVSREPVIYVRHIYKYYVAFRLIGELHAKTQE